MINWLLRFFGYKKPMIKFEGQTKKRKIDKIIIHCSSTPPDMNIGASEITIWHLDRGWSDIGYHYVIRRDGVFQDGRDTDEDGDIFEEVGAHTYGYNKNSIGICMVGGVDENNNPEANFTAKQWITLERLVRALKAEFPYATVHGHNEFAAKACPSFDVQEWQKNAKL